MDERIEELQIEVEKLLSLLKDRKPGCFTWNEAINDQVVAINIIWYKPNMKSNLSEQYAKKRIQCWGQCKFHYKDTNN